MCILFLAVGQHPRYPLVLAANRDERFDRPSALADYWQGAEHIYGGRDLEAGGSWLAVNRCGQIAAITNQRRVDLLRDDARSRGELVPEWLSGVDEVNFRSAMRARAGDYNPFNLLYGDCRQLSIFDSVRSRFMLVDKGFHSLSNGPMDDYWPKMSRGVSLLEQHVSDSAGGEIDTERLFTDMRDATKADDTVLPDTGVGVDIERHLSSIFITGDSEYGTRTTSLLLWDGTELRFLERDYFPDGQLHSDREERIIVSG